MGARHAAEEIAAAAEEAMSICTDGVVQ